MSTLFINGKPVVIIGLRKLRNLPSWLVFFLVVSLNKIPLFSKDLIDFIIYFVLLIVSVIPEPVMYSLLNASISLSRKFFF